MIRNGMLRTKLNEKLAELATPVQREELFVERRAELQEQMEHLSEVAMAAGRLTRESELRRQVSEALERITKGAYGVCERCQEMIAQRRLEAVPWARMCRRCQERADEASGGTLQ